VELVDQQISHSKNLEQTIISNLVHSETVKTALLQKAFEGKLVEQNPDDELASALLERIKKEREEYFKAEKERKKQNSSMLTKKKVKVEL
ncbi:MAG: type I restriction endonuclease subunit S, partial [Bacteroidota bacterium]